MPHNDLLHVIGVRHHSPACARLAADTIDRLRPAAVLIEGPADFNDRLGELALGHRMPVAVYSYLASGDAVRRSWTPLCDYSPEWVALEHGRAAGADVRFIDLPAWHDAFDDRENRYCDAERRYSAATERLCEEFAVDNTDALWDHLVETAEPDGLAERLDRYFELVRGDAETTAADTRREAYMAQWIRAALAAAEDRPVVVVCGGFHAPALRRLAAEPAPDAAWPDVPAPPDDADAGSYLVPYSFKRLDAFAGYQSGMPSPEYYQRLWEDGPDAAAAALTRLIAERLRGRGQPVSTADLIGARSLAEGLARLRGHPALSRTDLLDGLAGALISDDLEQPLPWSRRGHLTPGTHPAVVEMTAALTGDRTGALHPDTPAPPLVADTESTLHRLGIDADGERRLDLTDTDDRERSRVLHRLRLLAVPGVTRTAGPATGADVTAVEHWRLTRDRDRLPALIEAGAYGATLGDAVQALLDERAEAAGKDLGLLAGILFDAALCGRADLSDRLGTAIPAGIAACPDIAAVGRTLAVVLALWRHDHLFGTAGSDLHAAAVTACADRTLWLAEGLHAGPGPAEPGRIAACAALRDAVQHAPDLAPPVATVARTAERIAADPQAPPDLRGAAAGLAWTFGVAVDTAAAVKGTSAPNRLGDWLAGLFAVARDAVLADGESDVIAAVDQIVGAMPDTDFLIALPPLRQAFAYFPPRERADLARQVAAARGGHAHDLLARHEVDPTAVAEGRALDARVDAALAREHLTDTPELPMNPNARTELTPEPR